VAGHGTATSSSTQEAALTKCGRPMGYMENPAAISTSPDVFFHAASGYTYIVKRFTNSGITSLDVVFIGVLVDTSAQNAITSTNPCPGNAYVGLTFLGGYSDVYFPELSRYIGYSRISATVPAGESRWVVMRRSGNYSNTSNYAALFWGPDDTYLYGEIRTSSSKPSTSESGRSFPDASHSSHSSRSDSSRSWVSLSTSSTRSTLVARSTSSRSTRSTASSDSSRSPL